MVVTKDTMNKRLRFLTLSVYVENSDGNNRVITQVRAPPTGQYFMENIATYPNNGLIQPTVNVTGTNTRETKIYLSSLSMTTL